MIERQGCQLSTRAQCRLLGPNRSMVYYQRRGVSESDLAVMRLLDEQYTRSPQYGVERMTAWLERRGMEIGHNRVRRLIPLMGLEGDLPQASPVNVIFRCSTICSPCKKNS